MSTIEPSPNSLDPRILHGKLPMPENCADAVPVLSVSPKLDYQASLQRLLNPTGWRLMRARTIETALSIVDQERPPLVLCESSLDDPTWKELLAQITLRSDAPFLIVTSRQADDHLWAEALNLGAYDVLAQPFDMTEVRRTFSSAWLRWCDRHDIRRQTPLPGLIG